MAIELPGKGEEAGKIYVRAFTAGVSSDSPEVILTSGDVALVNFNEANIFVQKLEAQVINAFTSTCVFIIGDSADSDGWWTDTEFNCSATAANFNVAASTVGFASGKLYSSTSAILTNIAGAPAAGKAKFRITYMRDADTDLSPSTGL